VFKLFSAQDFDEESVPSKVIKISKRFETYYNGKITPTVYNNRFRQEVEALYECKRQAVENVVEIECDGNLICPVEHQHGKKVSFPFYVMEYAESDLKSYMEDEGRGIDDASRVEICLQLAQALNQLFNLGYYHRDIKPDNIFLIDGTWKIGDLGLISMRNKPSPDGIGELVGPRGWLSPEAMNKYLAERVNAKQFDCEIDHRSDIFQMAKVFWYVLQGNAPIGSIKESDFLFHNSELYSVIKQMLNHSKKKRPATIDEVILRLRQIVKKYYK
jgi:serine/threonine protein kinase